MRTLETREVTVVEALVLTQHSGMGHRLVTRGDRSICGDDPDTYARAARFAIEAGPLHGKSVAWIGGGLCVGPRVFAIADCEQDVYEIEPALREFCPDGVAFAEGDWRDTLKGEYDIIVYDLGDEPPKGLENFLRPGGKVLS